MKNPEWLFILNLRGF